MSHSTLTGTRFRSRITAISTAGVLALAAIALPASAAALPATIVPDEESALEQEVAQDEQIGDEQVVFEDGHVDLGPRLIDDAWDLLVRDDSSAPPVWRYPEDMVFRVPDDALQPVPTDNEDFDFIAAEPGQDLYVIPQNQDHGIPWLGWNTQDPEVLELLSRGITLRLHGVEGPGEVQLFLQSGNFDAPDLLWDSTQLGQEDSAPQDIWADSNTHVHANWVFTEPGIYLMDVEVFGELSGGGTGSDRDVLRFAVGDETDPQEGFTAELSYDIDQAAEDAAADPAEGADLAQESENGLSLGVIGLIVGAAILVLGVLALMLTLRSRRARQRAADSSPTDQEIAS